MNKNQAKILAAGVYQAIKGKKGQDLEKVVANFSEYLAQHHLVSMIPNILRELEKFYFADHNIIAAIVSSRSELDKQEVDKISKLVQQKTAKQVEIRQEQDELLLGGAVIRYDDKIIDMSLRHQLSNLAKQLSN